MTVIVNYIFTSDPFITSSRKNYTNLKKKKHSKPSFLKTMVRTFCATRTVTGYPCYGYDFFADRLLNG